MDSKNGGYPRFMEELNFQAKNPDDRDGWDPTALLDEANRRRDSERTMGSAVAFLGGFIGATCVIATGDRGVQLTAAPVFVTGAMINAAFDKVYNQGEGEAMIFCALTKLIELLASVPDGGHTAASLVVAIFDCQDVDAFGRAMPELNRMLALCADLQIPTTLIRAFINIHSKSTELLRKFGLLLQARGTGARLRSKVNGVNLQCTVDLLALRGAIEADEDAGAGGVRPGEKSVAATTALLAVYSNDMLQPIKGEITAAAVFAAFLSVEFRGLAGRYGHLVRENVVAAGPEGTYSIRHETTMLLLYVALKNRNRTNRQLRLRYGSDAAASWADPLSYTAVEACSLIAGENVPAPPPTAILARVSAVDVVFDQLSNFTARERPRPLTAELETQGSALVVQCDNSVKAVYTVMCPSPTKKRDVALDHLQRQFGRVLNIRCLAGFPFDHPEDTLVDTYLRGGVIRRAVAASHAFAPSAVMGASDLADFLNYQKRFEAIRGNAAALHSVISATICQHTCFNPKGMGRPLLTSSTLEDVVSNRGAWPAPWAEEEGEGAAHAISAEEGLYLTAEHLAVLVKEPAGEPEQFDKSLQLMFRVVAVVVMRAATVTAQDETDEDPDSAEGEEEAQEPPQEGGQTDDEGDGGRNHWGGEWDVEPETGEALSDEESEGDGAFAGPPARRSSQRRTTS